MKHVELNISIATVILNKQFLRIKISVLIFE